MDEADIGLIKKAKLEDRAVNFTVTAYPEELFTGEIEQIRSAAVDLQNVVTYPVVIGAANAERKLMPGMTATISFEVDSRTDVLKVPTTAIRFFPANVQHVRQEDRELLDGSRWKSTEELEDEGEMTAKEKTDSQKKKNKRHVWVKDGEFIKAVEIETGLAENKYTVMDAGDLQEGDKIITRQTR